MELNGMIAWADVMVHYMKIAIQAGKPSLAEIAIDAKDLEYMISILEFLKKQEGNAE